MKKVEAFQADDGTLHADAAAAVRHEVRVKSTAMVHKLALQLMAHGFEEQGRGTVIRDVEQMQAAIGGLLRQAESVQLLLDLAKLYEVK